MVNSIWVSGFNELNLSLTFFSLPILSRSDNIFSAVFRTELLQKKGNQSICSSESLKSEYKVFLNKFT